LVLRIRREMDALIVDVARLVSRRTNDVDDDDDDDDDDDNDKDDIEPTKEWC